MVEGKRLFTLHCDRSRRLCEIRWDFENRAPEQRTREEQRLFLQLGPNLVAVNVWLTTLGADRGYSFGTIHEYAKVLLYALTWLTQKPVQLGTQNGVELTLFRLSRAAPANSRLAIANTPCLRRHGTCALLHFRLFTTGSSR